MDDPVSEHHDEMYLKVRDKVMQSQNHTCQYCNFKSMFKQECHHIDDDHSNNSEDNLDTICVLCHSCFHIGYSGATERGLLAYMPDELNIDQAMLNNIIRTLWIGKQCDNTDISQRCTELLSAITEYTKTADMVIQSNNPLDLADFLLLLDDEQYEKRQQILGNNILFIPNESHFSPYISAWKEEIEQRHKAEDWIESAIQNIRKTLGSKSEDISSREILAYIDEIN